MNNFLQELFGNFDKAMNNFVESLMSEIPPEVKDLCKDNEAVRILVCTKIAIDLSDKIIDVLPDVLPGGDKK